MSAEEHMNIIRLKKLYKKIGPKLEHRIEKLLKHPNIGILPDKKSYTISADFIDSQAWKISTKLRKNYTANGEILMREELVAVRGMLIIEKFALKIDPAFKFTYETKGSKVAFNKCQLKKIMEAEAEREEWTTYTVENETTNAELGKMVIYDKAQEKKIDILKKEMGPALDQLGMTKNEQNLVIISALEHHSFSPNMPIEDLIGLTLRVRNQMLNP